MDIYNALRFEAPKNQTNLQITSQGLISGMQAKEHVLQVRYTAEEAAKYDPYKQRVVQAISKGLSNASIEHTAIMENELY